MFRVGVNWILELRTDSILKSVWYGKYVLSLLNVSCVCVCVQREEVCCLMLLKVYSYTKPNTEYHCKWNRKISANEALTLISFCLSSTQNTHFFGMYSWCVQKTEFLVQSLGWQKLKMKIDFTPHTHTWYVRVCLV